MMFFGVKDDYADIATDGLGGDGAWLANYVNDGQLSHFRFMASSDDRLDIGDTLDGIVWNYADEIHAMLSVELASGVALATSTIAAIAAASLV